MIDRTELDIASIIEQNVGTLNVQVENVACMDVRKTL